MPRTLTLGSETDDAAAPTGLAAALALEARGTAINSIIGTTPAMGTAPDEGASVVLNAGTALNVTGGVFSTGASAVALDPRAGSFVRPVLFVFCLQFGICFGAVFILTAPPAGASVVPNAGTALNVTSGVFSTGASAVALDPQASRGSCILRASALIAPAPPQAPSGPSPHHQWSCPCHTVSDTPLLSRSLAHR